MNKTKTKKLASKDALFVAAKTISVEPRLKDKIMVLPAMFSDILLGRWGKERSARRTMMFALLAVLYVVSPLDILPELLLTIPGMLDDAIIATWAATSVVGMASEYLSENEEPTIIYAQATRLT